MIRWVSHVPVLAPHPFGQQASIPDRDLYINRVSNRNFAPKGNPARRIVLLQLSLPIMMSPSGTQNASTVRSDALDIIMNLEAQEFTAADRQRWRGLTVHEPTTDEAWLELAELVAGRVGLRRMVELGDSRIWRQAIAETSRYPLPPLNLPLALWEGYLAHPFSSIKLHFADGPIEPVSDWSKIYYCWHTRSLALDLDSGVAVRAASDVVAVQAAEASAAQIGNLERLRWFQRADPFVPVAIRTSDGNVILVEQRDRIQLDDSASLVAIVSGSGPCVILVETR